MPTNVIIGYFENKFLVNLLKVHCLYIDLLFVVYACIFGILLFFLFEILLAILGTYLEAELFQMMPVFAKCIYIYIS